MNSDVSSQADVDEQILTFAIPDEVLERAAAAEQQAVTWIYCTHAWNCREGLEWRPIESPIYSVAWQR